MYEHYHKLTNKLINKYCFWIYCIKRASLKSAPVQYQIQSYD